MLFAHSLAEAKLYLTVNPCPSCSGGDGGSDSPSSSSRIAATLARVCAACVTCGKEQAVEFTILNSGAEIAGPSSINSTAEQSRIIDAGQWLTLARLFSEKARHEANRVEARALAMQSADCLREALKFYDEPDNDLPPPEALFTESSRRRFREAPQQFSRQRILGELQKLPTAAH